MTRHVYSDEISYRKASSSEPVSVTVNSLSTCWHAKLKSCLNFCFLARDVSIYSCVVSSLKLNSVGMYSVLIKCSRREGIRRTDM